MDFTKVFKMASGDEIIYQYTINYIRYLEDTFFHPSYTGTAVKVNDQLAFSRYFHDETNSVAPNYSGFGLTIPQDKANRAMGSVEFKSRFHDLSLAYLANYSNVQISLAEALRSKELIFLGLGVLGIAMLYGVFKFQMHRMRMEKNIDAQSLTLANAKLGIMLNQADSFLYQTDEEGRLIDISSNVKFVLGFNPSEMLGKPLEQFFKKKTIPLTGLERKDECIEMVTLFEDTVVVELNENFHFEKEDTRQGKFGIARNITKVVNVVKENHIEQKNKGALLDAIPDAIITLDYDGKLSDWKLPSSYTFPFEFQPETGALIHTLFPSAIATEIQMAFNEAGMSDNFHHKEISYKESNKTWFFECRAIRLSSDHVMVLIRDISSQKLLELDLEKGKIEAERSSRAKDQFISIMSHELKTPLNGILGMSHLLEDTSLSAEQRDYLKTLQESAQNLNTIISDILDFSKIVNGQVQVNKTWFEIAELIDYVCQSHSAFAEEKGLKFVYSILIDETRRVYQDFGKTAQILSQIIHNAIKFTHSGSVHLLVSGNEDRLQFRITDTGIGMDDTQLEELFKPFTQIDNSDTRKYGGTGLGLALSTRLVHVLGGSIKASSELGNGSSFTVEIPLKSTEKPLEWVPQVNRDEKVLVIDSNPITCSVVYKKLEGAGFEGIRNIDDCLSGKQIPDYVLINKHSELRPEQRNYIVKLADRSDILTIAFKLTNMNLEEVALPVDPFAEILLDGNVSNLKERLSALRP